MAGSQEKEITRSDKKIFLTDKSRKEGYKLLTADSLQEFLERGRELYNLEQESRAYIVLEEDGTEVDDEEYFSMLPDRTHLMILGAEELWSPNISLQGSCIFEVNSQLSSGLLAVALMDHLKRTTQVGESPEKDGTNLPPGMEIKN